MMRVVALFVCAMTIACAGAPRVSQPFEAPGVLPALPALFAPLTWTTDPSSLGAPSVWREHGSDDVVPFEHVSVDVAEWPALGSVTVQWMYVGRNMMPEGADGRRGAASLIELCNDADTLPRDADGTFNDDAQHVAAQRTFDVARAALEPELGPGRDDDAWWPGQAHGYGRKEGEHVVVWDAPGVTITLDVGQQEEAAWYACVSALRAGAPWTAPATGPR